MSYAEDDLSPVFMTHYATLLNFVKRRVRSTEVAHDIVQDTWLRVAESRTVAPIANPLAFFYRIAGNLTIDRQRETAVRERYIESATCRSMSPMANPATTPG